MADGEYAAGQRGRTGPTRATGAITAAVLLLLLALLPAAQPPAFFESFLYLVFFWISLATSWMILSGLSGYVSFGHGTFYGIGVYAVANLAPIMPFGLAIVLGGVAAALAGVAIGAVVFRVRHLRGELFALLTLASTFVLATIALNTPIDGGPGVALNVALPEVFGSTVPAVYWMGLLVAAGSMAAAYLVQNSKLGRGLLAISDDEDVAEIQGVPTFRYKLAAFAMSAFFAGLAGGVYAIFVSYVTVAETFSITVPLYVLLMSGLGGARHWIGPAIGASLIAAVTYLFVSGDSALFAKAALGAALVAATLYMPGGVVGLLGGLFGGAVSRGAPDATILAPPLEPRPAHPSTGKPLLQCRDLRIAFSGIKALDGVDIDVAQGEILGLVGPNGSGKSTLVNVISGLYTPNSGQILFNGRDLAGSSGHAIAHAGVARTFQIPRPFARCSVLENVALSAAFGAAARSRATSLSEARTWLDFVGLADRADDLPSELNLHERKFLELARALATRPQLIMLDEVLAGLTPSEITSAITLVRRIRDQGAAIIFVEHNIRAVLNLADRLIVLNNGRKIGEGDPRQVLQQPAVVAAYLGSAHVEA